MRRLPFGYEVTRLGGVGKGGKEIRDRLGGSGMAVYIPIGRVCSRQHRGVGGSHEQDGIDRAAREPRNAERVAIRGSLVAVPRHRRATPE